MTDLSPLFQWSGGLLALAALLHSVHSARHKESKEEAAKRDAECQAKVESLSNKIDTCDGERVALQHKLDIMLAKQEIMEKVLPMMMQIRPKRNGRRTYDKRQVG